MMGTARPIALRSVRLWSFRFVLLPANATVDRARAEALAEPYETRCPRSGPTEWLDGTVVDTAVCYRIGFAIVSMSAVPPT